MKDKKLGKGLDFLFGAAPAETAKPAVAAVAPSPPPLPSAMPAPSATPIATPPGSRESRLLDIPVADIFANPNQPRKEFDQDQLDSLAASIRAEGIVQPVVVRRTPNGYELVSGERRWRAAQRAGLQKVPSILVEADDQRSLQLALIENIQRSDLNAMEKAMAFAELLKITGFTQEEASAKLGMDRSTLANFVRLLDLPQDVQQAVSRGTISMGHARSLLAVDSEKEIRYLARRVETEGMSVRRLENIVKLGRRRGLKKASGRDALVQAIEDKLREFFGTKVTLEARKKRGRILIDYYENKQLDSILIKLGISV